MLSETFSFTKEPCFCIVMYRLQAVVQKKAAASKLALMFSRKTDTPCVVLTRFREHSQFECQSLTQPIQDVTAATGFNHNEAATVAIALLLEKLGLRLDQKAEDLSETTPFASQWKRLPHSSFFPLYDRTLLGPHFKKVEIQLLDK
jgi:hypothetical protein